MDDHYARGNCFRVVGVRMGTLCTTGCCPRYRTTSFVCWDHNGAIAFYHWTSTAYARFYGLSFLRLDSIDVGMCALWFNAVGMVAGRDFRH